MAVITGVDANTPDHSYVLQPTFTDANSTPLYTGLSPNHSGC